MKINIGDIVSVTNKDYVIGVKSQEDLKKIDFQVFDYDRRDLSYELRYIDLSGKERVVWVPKDLLVLKCEYNFWLKRKKLIELLKKKTFDEIRRDMLSEDRYGW